MELTREEINRNRTISATVTALIFALFILFLIFFKLITPNPPFPESGANGGGQELALGFMEVGNDVVDFTKMGEVTDVVAEVAPSEEQIVTAVGGEKVQVEENTTPEIKDNKMVVKPLPPKEKVPEKTEAEKLREKILNKQHSTGGGVGNNQQAGQTGEEDGNPFAHGQGGTGTSTVGTGHGGGNETGPPGQGGKGGGKYGFDLKGRSVVQPPKLPKDTEEEGKVVVEITVDAQGNVTEANPNGRGTTTSSATLKQKAAMAAKATKFNVDGKFEEQRGTITIIFSFN